MISFQSPVVSNTERDQILSPSGAGGSQQEEERRKRKKEEGNFS